MKELGKESLSMHKEILESALNQKTYKVFLLGDHMHQAAKEIKNEQADKMVLCKNLDEMASVLSHELAANDILLIKGSRSMQMEKIMAFLP
jgi:UDP-N-acetylmuramoyl-tripeptide--D-alanyl-D-alanine ligase